MYVMYICVYAVYVWNISRKYKQEAEADKSVCVCGGGALYSTMCIYIMN